MSPKVELVQDHATRAEDSQGPDVATPARRTAPATRSPRVTAAAAAGAGAGAWPSSGPQGFIRPAGPLPLDALLQRAVAQRAGPVVQRSPASPTSNDANEIKPARAVAAFSKTIGQGLLTIAVVGAFVGAEFITAGQATWLLVAVAGTGGLKDYLDRREEIEQQGYHVPIPDTIVHSGGGIVGVSQLAEAIMGERLGTRERLSSEARSDRLGEGAGALATLLTGSRAYRQGQAIGVQSRIPKTGSVPSGPNANVRNVKIPDDPMPSTPTPSPQPGPVEASMRARLPDPTKLGFDKWMADIRARGADPEKVLAKQSPQRVESTAEQFARAHAVEVNKGLEAARLTARSMDNPLQPILKNPNIEVGKNVWIHYETKPPGLTEITHAIAIAARTGEVVHLFGDTASKVTYPGIDGTIGFPPRPLSLKSHSAGANAASARFAAQQALLKAKTHNYTEVEVEISMPGKTVAEVKAAWDVKPNIEGAHDLGAYYEGTTVAKITIQCRNGEIWVPPKSTSVPMSLPNLGQRRDEKKK